MASIFDFLTGNNAQPAENANSGIDPVSSYLGNLIDPTTTQGYADANRNRTLLGLAAGLLSQGASRTPITFGQSFGAGLQGALSAQNGFADSALKSAQTGDSVAQRQLRGLQGLGLLQDMNFAQQQADAMQKMYAGGDTGGTTGTGSLSSNTLVPSNVSTSGAETGSRAAAVLKNEFGWHDGAIAGALNNGFSESGGISWGNTGAGGENGFWQFHPKTHLPAFTKAQGGDTSPEAQARYLGNVVKSSMPNYVSIADPQIATAQFLRGFERPKNQSDAEVARRFAFNGQTASILQNLAGPGNRSNPLMPVPNFTGRMNGAEGPGYGPTQSVSGTGAVPLPNVNGTAALPPGFSAQQVAAARLNAALSALRGKTPDPLAAKIGGYAIDAGLDAQKALTNKQLEIAGAGPITAAQEGAKDVYGIQPNVTLRNPDGSYSESALPNPLFRQLIGQQYGGGSPAPQSVPGSNYSTNLVPQLPGQPQMPVNTAPQTPQGTGTGTAAIPAPQSAQVAPGGSMGGGYRIGRPILDPTAQVNPSGYDFSPRVGQGPGQNQPLIVPSTPEHPYSTSIPPLSEQAPLRMSGVNAGEIQKGWVQTTQKLAEAQSGIQASKLLLTKMGEIFQRYESGSFSTYQSELMAGLNSLGISTPNGVNKPEDAQQILKDNFQAALQTMKATGIGRFTQLELSLASQNFANPNLRPAANFAILTQDFGKILQAEAMSKDWALANRAGWVDPQSFAQQWYNQTNNDLKNFVGRAALQFGTGFKGMTPQEQQQMIPTLGTTPDGTRVMRLPGGKVVPL